MKYVLPVIVLSQFFCTSLWFAGNAIMPDLVRELSLSPDFVAHITSAVQFGFISGTLLFAILTISDRFSPSKVFFSSALIAAIFNVSICFLSTGGTELLIFRFLTGFFLAGIYPVGMKIASDYYQKGLGRSLGFLVGALVLGTAFPHLIRNFTSGLPWKYVIYSTSAFSLAGGVLIGFLVPDGPFRKPSQKFNFTVFLSVFRNSNFRSPAFGYFGHMWELYTFWAFVPLMLTAYNNIHHSQLNVPLWSFIIIALGGPSCVLSGLLSQRYSPSKIARTALLLSGVCCLLSPLLFSVNSPVLMLLFLIFWGLVVIADSPLFSTLVAFNAPQESRGTSLTIVNCIGFLITIISIQFINYISSEVGFPYTYIFLAIGPVFGILYMSRKSWGRALLNTSLAQKTNADTVEK